MDTQTPIRLQVHLEAWCHALYLPEEWEGLDYRLDEPMKFLIKLLDRHQVKATFYVLGDVALRYPESLKDLLSRGHHLGSHGFFHRHGEYEGDTSDELTRSLLPECVGYTSPFWSSTPRPGFAGGVFLRTFPYPLVKYSVQQYRTLWIHPHDVDLKHPRTSYVPARRLVGQQRARHVLDHLLSELPFEH